MNQNSKSMFRKHDVCGRVNDEVLNTDSASLIIKAAEDPESYIKARYTSLLYESEQGISDYLALALENGHIDQQLHDDATKNTFPNLQYSLTRRINYTMVCYVLNELVDVSSNIQCAFLI